MAWSCVEDVVGVSVKYTPSSNGVDGFFAGSYGCLDGCCSDMVLILLFADGFCRFREAGRRCGCAEVGEGCCKKCKYCLMKSVLISFIQET